jgi:hypothetical protein
MTSFPQPDVAVACRPNISPAGVRRRRRFGQVGVGLALAVAAVTIALHAPWWARGVAVFLPGAGGAVSWLQATRLTCVAHAARGTFEHDDFTTTRQSAEDAAASRRVAATIRRDGALIGLGMAALAASTAWL